MAYSMDSLSGFLRIGPQTYPPRRKGAQIIQRGPHGMRIAADPVISRSGKKRGSGFRWWTEQSLVKADEEWNPRQLVVGIMGLGEGDERKTEASSSEKNRLTEAALQLATQARNSKNPGLIAQADLLEWQLNKYFPFQQSSGHFTPSIIWAGSWDSSQTIRSNLQLTRSLVKKNAAGIAVSSAAAQPLTSVSAPKETAKQFWGTGTDPVSGKPITQGTLDERVREIMEGGLCSPEQVRVPVVGAFLCKGVGEPRSFAENPLLTAAIVAGGAVFVYGLAKAVGQQLLKRS